MKKIVVIIAAILFAKYNLYALDIPFDPFTGAISSEILKNDPAIEKDRFVYSTSIEFYRYTIEANIYKYMDEKKGDDFIFFPKSKSMNIDVFSQFIKEVLDYYSEEATYIYFNLDDEDTIIHRSFSIYQNEKNPISIYINISTEVGIVGLGISSTKEEIFSEASFFNNLDDWFYDYGENIYDKSEFKFDKVTSGDSYIDLGNYVSLGRNHIAEEHFNIVFAGLPDKGFSKSIFIKKPDIPKSILLSGFDNAKNLIITIDQKYMRTADSIKDFTINPEDYYGKYIFINIKGIMEYNQDTSLLIVNNK